MADRLVNKIWSISAWTAELASDPESGSTKEGSVTGRDGILRLFRPHLTRYWEKGGYLQCSVHFTSESQVSLRSSWTHHGQKRGDNEAAPVSTDVKIEVSFHGDDT